VTAGVYRATPGAAEVTVDTDRWSVFHKKTPGNAGRFSF